eukprot:jgi/Botrbrau1/8722/Bobra.0311s0032.1
MLLLVEHVGVIMHNGAAMPMQQWPIGFLPVKVPSLHCPRCWCDCNSRRTRHAREVCHLQSCPATSSSSALGCRETSERMACSLLFDDQLQRAQTRSGRGTCLKAAGSGTRPVKIWGPLAGKPLFSREE